MQAPRVVYNGSVSWPDGVKGDLNQALVSLGLVFCMLSVFISCVLGFSVVTQCSYIWFCEYQPRDWLGKSSLNLPVMCRVE